MPGERYDFVVHAHSDTGTNDNIFNHINFDKMWQLILQKKDTFELGPREVVQWTKSRVSGELYVEDQSNYEKLISHARPYPNQLDYDLPFEQNPIVSRNH